MKVLYNIDHCVYEMLNLEAGRELFVDGVFVNSNKRYPSVKDKDGVLYELKLYTGVIITTFGKDHIVSLLKERIDCITAWIKRQLAEEGKSTNIYPGSYSAHIDPHVALRKPLVIDDLLGTYRSFSSCLRMGPSSKFMWCVLHPAELRMEIVRCEVEEAIALHIGGIVLDRRDIICAGVADQYSLGVYKAWNRVVDIGVTLCNIGHPLTFELSRVWRSGAKSSTNVFRPLSKRITGRYVWDDVLNFDGAEERRCIKCGSELFGEVYALTRPARVEKPTGALCCAPCLHSSPIEAPMERQYISVYVVDAGGVKEIIAAQPTIYRDVYTEACLGVVRRGNLLLVGKKYIAGTSVLQFVLSGVASEQMAAGRMFIRAKTLAFTQ